MVWTIHDVLSAPECEALIHRIDAPGAAGGAGHLYAEWARVAA
jgi:hypothetical protein